MNPVRTVWRARPKKVILRDNEVHLWRSSLQLGSEIIEKLRSTLSADEIERANRFRSQKDRYGFIAGRGILRSILADYLKRSPGEIVLRYNDHGKPYISNMPVSCGIDFNLSHSEGLAAYAFTRGRRVGIDLERLRLNLSFEKIAKRFFTASEFASLAALDKEELPGCFFTLWTRKEACIKAKGKGLSIPLNRFVVTTDNSQIAGPKPAARHHDNAQGFSLHSFTPAPGYIGALAVEGKSLEIKHWIWPV